MTNPNFLPSPEQESIFVHLTSSSAGNVFISACAGSGKSTTLVQALHRITPPRPPGPADPFAAFSAPAVRFLVFNKANATDLQPRVPSSVSCSTFHSLGNTVLRTSGALPRTSKVDGRRCAPWVYNALGSTSPDALDTFRLIGLAKSVPQAPADVDLEALASSQGLSFDDPSLVFRTVLACLERSISDLSSIDFDDMLWLPVQLRLDFPASDWVFIDEAQDTNAIQLVILNALRSPATRYVFVGDPHQAIYGFRGAGTNSVDTIKSVFETINLPLSFTYRCPKAVVREAQKYCKILTA